ncbi:unnamed protein product [Prunus armeniaca]|uniref:Uncharacterized protein n=1 Tax=Prunus armeniaca TaxID=36596 RepID=A0A6J5V4E7_PRUAR|nr:unnamed protein product [Prunus armeniaca]
MAYDASRDAEICPISLQNQIHECYPTIISSTISAFFACLIPPEEFLASSPSEVVVVNVAQIRRRLEKELEACRLPTEIETEMIAVASDVKKDVVR